jgi:hypothetical protein
MVTGKVLPMMIATLMEDTSVKTNEGGGVDEDTTVSPGSCGNRYYITWLIPVSLFRTVKNLL